MKHKCKLAESIWKYNLFCVSNQNKKITGHIDLDKWTCKATKKFHDTWNKYEMSKFMCGKELILHSLFVKVKT